MKPKQFCQTAAVIFGIIALLHLWRALMKTPAQFGSWAVPIWLSWIAVIVAGWLAYTAWTAR